MLRYNLLKNKSISSKVFGKVDDNIYSSKNPRKEEYKMRIEAYSQIQQMYGASKPANKTASAKNADFKDKLQISNVGKDMQVAKQAVSDAPDIREDKIAAIKQRLANGTYEVSGEEFAQKMMERLGQALA